ncbi:MAG: ABC transporter substrate-binding protein [Anaerolineae bacterium]|jgi:peptide/nickel transport system substrate-binding protein|nr:ABC transporter substrate-binding protein [Anaerolineae bacterium]
MREKVTLLTSVLVIAAVLVGCATPTPQIIKETVEVPVEKTVVVKETVEVPVEVTQVPTEVTYARNETLYVSGAAWGPPSDWNPFITWSKANTTGTIGLVYETLFLYDPLTDKYIPWLAESGKWVDADTYVLKLREGITWSDGQPLTAADVVFTYELGKKYAAIWFSPMWTYLKSATATSDYEVTFEFTEHPLYQEWDNNLYNIAIVPKHLWESRTEEEITAGANENPVGSGAYLYETHSEDRNVWVRNENWWATKLLGLKPAPKRIVDMRFSSNNVALGAVIKGEVDLSNNFLPGIATLSEKGYVKTYFAGPPYMLSANTAVLFLNTTKKPMDDPAFRKAVAFAINTNDIVNVAYANLVKAANPTGLLPSLEKYVDKDVVARLGFSYDPDKAKQILADAGYKDVDGDGFVEAPDGSKIELEVTCPFGWTDWMEAIKIIANSAQAAGINIKDATPDYGAWNTALTTGTFDMTLNNWAGMSNTPWTLYNLLFRHPIQDVMGSGNFGRYNNQQMFDLVDQLAATPSDDVEGMKAVCSQIQELMLTEMPVIPLWYNGLWAQYSDAVWTNWPTEESNVPSRLPCTWSGYWQMGGLLTLTELKLKPTE